MKAIVKVVGNLSLTFSEMSNENTSALGDIQVSPSSLARVLQMIPFLWISFLWVKTEFMELLMHPFVHTAEQEEKSV